MHTVVTKFATSAFRSMTLSLAATAVGVMLFAPTSASADPSQAIIEAARKEATQASSST